MTHLPVTKFDISSVETLVFAGGGNRCWWQGGAIAHLLQQGWNLPPQLEGTSAGAGVAASCITDGLAGSIAAGTLAYVVDKHVWNSIHPRLPKLVGLRQDFVDLHECRNSADAQALLGAAAAAPPFMRSSLIGGLPAIDGGYTDNAPIHPQSAAEKSKTLVLLTRHYPRLPQLFRWAGRTYWQPSQSVPVSTWDCRENTTVREAFALGESDAKDVLGQWRLSVA